MNKAEMVDHIARHADISKAAAERALDAVINGVKTSLKKNTAVSLVGLGTFSVGKREARSGRNPQTGAPISIKAARIPRFRAGKALKDALN
ncbi:HU family DNA-binding protein [Piscinibacter koreensis]|uniref:HU family DNA-binding protein n=1 Tax=Piscinibacter koreensis TaxID=2742824 RepID=A0A7Y6NNG3_9BURK|nr:HU family DNA-binding protein [Schlegelella koreensis]